jgi:hypothetical protein
MIKGTIDMGGGNRDQAGRAHEAGGFSHDPHGHCGPCALFAPGDGLFFTG